MNTKSKISKTIINVLTLLVFSVSVFIGTFFAPQVQVDAATGPTQAPPNGGSTGSEYNNGLLLIADHCQGLAQDGDGDDALDEDIGTGVGNYNTCHDLESLVQENLGCGDLFYTHDFKVDPQDDGVVEAKWYINEGAYKECYNRAKAQYELLSSAQCKTVSRDPETSTWDQCETNQNQLHSAIGCSDEMFEEVNDGHWSPKSAELSACKDQVTRIGNVHITVIENEKPVRSKHAIKDGAVKADDTGTSGSTSDEDGEQSCGSGANFSLSWILCPLIEGGTDVSKSFFNNVLQELLDNVPISSSRKDPGYKAWSSFRLLANVVIIGALLALVYGTARGEK